MSGPLSLDGVRTSLEAAEATMARTLKAERSAVILADVENGQAELAVARGVPRDVARALLRASGEIVERLGLAGEPIQLDPSRALNGQWRSAPVGSFRVVPILGEMGVVGFAAFPDPAQPGTAHRADPSWRLASRTLKCAQLTAAHDALRIALAWERRNRAELVDGLLVVDSEGRVLFADGRLAAVPAWGGSDPMGRRMDVLPHGDALAAIARTDGSEPAWAASTVPELGIAGPVELASVLRRPKDPDAGYVLLLRRPEHATDPGDGTARMVAFTMRVSQLADEIAHSIRLVKASSVKGAATALLGPMENAVVAASRSVEEGLSRSLPDANGALDVNALVEDVLARCRSELEAERVRAVATTDDTLPVVPGDRFVVLGALRTVMLTARDFLRPGGGTLTLRTSTDDDWVQIAVADNGGGAHDGDRDERVFVTHGEAYDSALDAVRRRLERIGGRLVIDRREGLWNRSTIMLRTERRRARREDEPRPAAEEETEGLRVLVVDDNAALRSVLRRYLERRGHAVTEASDGEEGLRVLQGRQFDRLVVDIQMPHKDGLELFGELDDVQPELAERTIFVTGGFLDDSVARAIRAAGRPWVRKPFDLTEMATTVERGGR